MPAAGWEVALLQRFAYGWSETDAAAARALGSPQAWVEAQLDPERLADPDGDTVRALYPELAWRVADVRAKVRQFEWDAMFALGQASFALAALSRRQLLEQMVAFWSNHLNVTSPSDGVWDNRPDYDRTVIRAHALGRFDEMLVASARHPAMLRYLNGADSTADAPNENYGRELLELHTVGVGAGYTEAMVKDSARLLTGWTVDAAGLAAYDASLHWVGPVRVLDFAHANADPDGRAAAEAYLRYLARHPATARRIARKLAVRFVADEPPAALVDELARLYLDAGTDVRPLLRRLVLGAEWRSGGKLKTPYEDVVSTVRVLGAGLLPGATGAQQRKGVEALYGIVDGLRAAPLAWHPPDGYPDVAVRWMATDLSLGRWNAHQTIAAGWWPDRTLLAVPDSRTLLPASAPATHGGLIDALAARLLRRPLSGPEREAVLGFVGAGDAAPLVAGSEWLGWRLPYLVALVLDTPSFADRS